MILVILLIVFFNLLYRQFSNPGNSLFNRNSQPTPNLTAVAQWTPTPNSPDQAENVIGTAWPTPVTRIMPADREAFRAAFLEKLTAESINWTLLANLNHAGVAWRCSDIKLGDISLPASTSGTMVALWASWYGGVDNTTMTIDIENGSNAPPVENTANNSLDIYQYAKVSINFPDFGLVGPEILQGNEVALTVDKPSIFYGVWLTPREWITGEDLISQKQNDNTNAALDWAKIDSIAPLQSDGTRDQTYLDLLYLMTAGSLDPNIQSLTLPNNSTVLIDHSIFDTLLTLAKEAAIEAGYADVESLSVTVKKPDSLAEYHYLANLDNPVIPSDILDQMSESTCPQVKLDPGTLTALQQVELPENALEGILKRLLEITKE